MPEADRKDRSWWAPPSVRLIGRLLWVAFVLVVALQLVGVLEADGTMLIVDTAIWGLYVATSLWARTARGRLRKR